MNIYSLLKLNRLLKNPFAVGFGIWLFHVLNKRYLAIFFDPILACNLRCKMCYFSNEEKRKTFKGFFADNDLSRIAEVIFPHALKLQIGCGAEPTLFKHNVQIVKLAKQYKIPYISLTTNANLLSSDLIEDLLDAGLNEFTISLHGVNKESYEYLMQGASYEKFLSALNEISRIKDQYTNSKLRVNFTVCEENMDELEDFFKVFDAVKIDILQVRPMQDIGGEKKNIVNQSSFNKKFNTVSLLLKDECSKRNITYIAPLQLEEKMKENRSSSIMDSTYCYISPRCFFHSDLDWHNETFRQYAKRTKYAKRLFKQIFSKKQYSSKHLGYEIN